MATIYDNYTPYGSLIEHHLRIGDTEFYVPPTSISVHRQTNNKRAKILRGRNSLPKESGYYNKIIELSIFFPNMDSINTELRPLLAQVKKCPFLPIENTYLNDIHKVDAVTISDVTIQTTPGFPHTLQAQIQCYAFEPYSYISDSSGRTFDQMFDWELFRWYYQRNLDPQLKGEFQNYYEPLYSELDNSFMFRIAAEDDLAAIKSWKKEKDELIRTYIKEKRENFWNNDIREKKFNKEYDQLYKEAMFEDKIHYEEYDIPGLILTDFSIGFQNTISSLQLQESAIPTHQYMGSQDTVLVARFMTTNEESIASLEGLIERSAYLIRTYHREIANGFIELDCQLARLFGVKNVTIEDVKTNTVANQPGVYEVQVTMVAYNRMERKLNEVKWLTETTNWEIDKYEDQGFWSLITSLNPYYWFDELLDENPTDFYKVFPMYRWGKFISDRPAISSFTNGLSSFFKGHNQTEKMLEEDGIKAAIYNESVKQILRSSEVYPDLELPTYGEVEAAGFKIENTNDGVFVDPDFFIKYEPNSMFYEDIVHLIDQNYQTVLRDGIGGEMVLTGGKVTSMNSVTLEEIEASKKEYETSKSSNQADYTEISDELKDEGNITKVQMETLIREKAEAVGLNQNFPLALAKTMDASMRQFYTQGTNADFNKVVSFTANSPIMMNNNFKYYTNADETIDGEYIGAMRVRPIYGANINLLGKNIEYNIETGVTHLAHFYGEVKELKANSNNKNVYALFGLKTGKTFDDEKALYAGAVMLYLGFEKEYDELIKNNKQPPSRIVSLIKDVLKGTTQETEWTTKQIEEKASKLPIKDFKSTNGVGATPKEAAKESVDYENDEIYKGMLHDSIKYDKRGRLVRAFPTFFLSLIDEGQFVGTVKMSDQFFSYSAIMDIMYTNSRKEASSTLVLEMANIYGTLDDAEKAMDLTNTTYREVFKTATLPGAIAQKAENSRHRNENYYKSIMLRTGTRLHFRMGYGSNPMAMPTIMNGTIAGIQNNGESLTVVAQDDGIELTNKIRADVNETTNGGFLFSKKEPTEIVDEILTDSQGFFKNMWAGLSNKEFENHSLGIMHFGSQQKPQGWEQLSSFFGGAKAGAAAGALTGGAVGGPIGIAIGGIAGSLAGGLFGSVTFGKEARSTGEITMNIYQTTGLTNEEHDKWWNKVKDAFGIGESDEPGINIGLYDKTPWDVLNICASVGDDHIVAVHPFGFRNTIFSGKAYFPLHYDYIAEGDSIVGTAVKPFKQLHYYDSISNILDNSIETNEENVRTVAVGVYMNEGEMDTTSPIYVDSDIWPEKQRVVNIDTTMNAQGVRLVENIPLIGGLLNKPMKWYYDEGVALKITARGLSDYVRDMYDGYITTIGDPSVKPYDQCVINDTFSNITGPIDVKEVTQIMNHDVGYITLTKPDVVVVNSDQKTMSFGIAAASVIGNAGITGGLRRLLSTPKYAGHLPIFNAIWAATVKSYDRMFDRFDAAEVKVRNLVDRITGKKPKNPNEILEEAADRQGIGTKTKDLLRWSQNGMLDKLKGVTGTGKEKLHDLLKNKSLYNNIKNAKFTEKASSLISSGGRKMGTIFKSVGGVAKMMWTGGHVMAGPLGWLALAVETLAVSIITSTVGEWLERFLMTRQCCIINPLRKNGYELTAGINGHKGSVVGDQPDFWQGLLTNSASAGILAFLTGADTAQFSAENTQNVGAELGLQSSGGSDVKPVSSEEIVSAFFNKYRLQPSGMENLKEAYEIDRKASLDQISKRVQTLDERNRTKAVHDEEEKSWQEWLSGIGDKISGWFSDLWDNVKSFFGSQSSESVCEVSDTDLAGSEVSLTGKAINLSKYFNVIGPKIEQEATLQGLATYAEIIKAKCMQESGGNYIKYPDVMQASESMGKPIGYIKNVDASIKQGVKYFGQVLKKAGGDVKLALQSYNFGSGFVDYVKSRGGAYTPELAYSFSEYMVQKMGRKISRIPPGYGDSQYVSRVLRYYSGALPAGGCSNSESGTIDGSSSCPDGTSKAARAKQLLSNSQGPKVLTDLTKVSGRLYDITLVGDTSTSLVRPGTVEALNKAANIYKKSTGQRFVITSGWRKGGTTWHGTGWAADIDTPNTMRTIGGKMRFPKGKQKEQARALCDATLQAGFRELYFGDWDIVQEMNKKYGKGSMNYDPAGHWNHLHCSYPACKSSK